MKHLKIIYNEQTLYDGEVAEFSWAESDNGVRVEGRNKAAKPKPAQGGGGILDMLTGMSKQKTADMIEDKKAVLEAEKNGVVVESG